MDDTEIHALLAKEPPKDKPYYTFDTDKKLAEIARRRSEFQAKFRQDCTDAERALFDEAMAHPNDMERRVRIGARHPSGASMRVVEGD